MNQVSGKESGVESKLSGADRRKADYKSEIHYIGEIAYGSLFPENEELFCEASLEISGDWSLLNQHAKKCSIQTQCCTNTVFSLFFI